MYDSGVVALKVIRVPQLERISTEPYDSWSREVRDICMAKSVSALYNRSLVHDCADGWRSGFAKEQF